jgi:hypothetical protein
MSPPSTRPAHPGEPPGRVRVDEVMRALEANVRTELRSRLLARGGPPEYRDEEVFATVERVLRRALEGRDRDVLLVPELSGDETDWRLRTRLTFSSHRPVVGPVIVFLKRRLLLPMLRWLHEYNLENFRRQERINRMLFACLEELAIENAKLRRAVGPREE